MKAFSCDRYTIPLPPSHSFPMVKYPLLRGRVLEEGIVTPSDLREPPAATVEQLLLVHDPAYVERVLAGRLSPAEVRELGLPWSEALVERSRRSVGGTIEAARWALNDGVGVNLSGGTHHAARDKGAGYCVFNDVAVAIIQTIWLSNMAEASPVACAVVSRNQRSAVASATMAAHSKTESGTRLRGADCSRDASRRRSASAPKIVIRDRKWAARTSAKTNVTSAP